MPLGLDACWSSRLGESRVRSREIFDSKCLQERYMSESRTIGRTNSLFLPRETEASLSLAFEAKLLASPRSSTNFLLLHMSQPRKSCALCLYRLPHLQADPYISAQDPLVYAALLESNSYVDLEDVLESEKMFWKVHIDGATNDVPQKSNQAPSRTCGRSGRHADPCMITLRLMS